VIFENLSSKKSLTNSSEKAVLNTHDTLKEVIDCLTEHISIKTQGACNQTDLSLRSKSEIGSRKSEVF
jgi:hypothetical protein